MGEMSSGIPDAVPETETEILTCRVTRWYYRRMSIAAGMCVAFGLYFLYDWKIGYPAANAIAEKQEWFEKVLLPSHDAARKEGRLDAWREEAKAGGWPTGKGDEPPKWLQYAAMNGWPEKPKRYTDKEVAEQLWWGLGTLGAGLVLAVAMLLNRNKVLTAGADHWVTPEGEKVAFADVFRVDKRKWERQGLAYAWYRLADGRQRRAVIDDLKFGGAEQILERLLRKFRGELVEKVPDQEETEGLPDGKN